MKARQVDKAILARSFSHAARHYDAWAVAQTEIATGLARRLPAGAPIALMVDLGCGSGVLSALLLDRYPNARMVGVDLAEGMVEACKVRWANLSRACFRVGDVEDIRHIECEPDLVASSCVAHWFSDPAQTLRMWGDALKPGGILACAFVIEGSFCELEESYREALGREFRGLRFWDRETACRLAVSDKLHPLRCDEELVVAWYDSALEALRSFRRIGAVFQGQQDYRALSPAQMRRLLACYNRHADATGRIPVTHRVLFCLAEKSR